MSKKQNVKQAARPDPTLPKTPVTVGGKTYNLCFDVSALIEAETAINAELMGAGREPISLLFALPPQTMGSAVLLFAAGVRTFHPEIGFEEAKKLVSFADVVPIATAVIDAYSAATPERSSDPPRAGE